MEAIRGMENVKIGKKYQVFNRECGVLDKGVLTWIEHGPFTGESALSIVLHFKDGDRMRSVYADDCGVIPYSKNNYNRLNVLWEVK